MGERSNTQYDDEVVVAEVDLEDLRKAAKELF